MELGGATHTDTRDMRNTKSIAKQARKWKMSTESSRRLRDKNEKKKKNNITLGDDNEKNDWQQKQNQSRLNFMARRVPFPTKNCKSYRGR